MIYLLYYDTDNGAREEWNTFYTPVEAYTDANLRAQRMTYIRENHPRLDMHTVDVPVSTVADTSLAHYDDPDEDEEIVEREYRVVDEFEPTTNPADYYFHTYESQSPWDLGEEPETITVVNVCPAAYYDQTGYAWDHSVDLELNELFTELMECEYEYAGTPEEARAQMLSWGFRENAAYSKLIDDYMNLANG